MCQAKITDHYSNKYKCLRTDYAKYEVMIIYNNLRMKNRVKRYTKILCSKHAKIFRYNHNRKRDKGHEVNVTETIL